jgi:hypothetical protein
MSIGLLMEVAHSCALERVVFSLQLIFFWMEYKGLFFLGLSSGESKKISLRFKDSAPAGPSALPAATSHDSNFMGLSCPTKKIPLHFVAEPSQFVNAKKISQKKAAPIGSGFEFQYSSGLYYTLIKHCISNFYKTSNVGSFYIINVFSTFTILHACFVDVHHNSVQLAVYFLTVP